MNPSRFIRLPSCFAILLFAVAAPTLQAQCSIVRVSVDASGAEGNSFSGALSGAAFSGDGRYVAFESLADNLVSGDTNGAVDVFVREMATGTIVRVSVGSSGGEGDGPSSQPSLSTDGRFVAFSSYATNLVANDTNRSDDVFVHDRDPDGNGVFDEGNGTTVRASVRTNGAQGNDDSDIPAISGDGSILTFRSFATNLVNRDLNGVTDAFVRDLVNGTTSMVSLDSLGGRGSDGNSWPNSISSDGNLISFTSFADNLIAGDTNGFADCFVFDRSLATTSRVSVDSSGNEGDGDSMIAVISADGSTVAFQSAADNLVTGDTNAVVDVFVHELASGVTERVSVDTNGVEGDLNSVFATLSSDGKVVAFESDADNWAANDSNLHADIFVRNRVAATTICASMNCAGALANAYGSHSARVSHDGLEVAFATGADNLVVGDTNAAYDVFVADLANPPPLAAWSTYGAGFVGTSFVPTLTPSANPVFGSSLTIDASNSLGATTFGLLIVGSSAASISTNRGGTILVTPDFLFGIGIPSTGFSLPVTVPADLALCGTSAFLQVIEADSGAALGFSFTPGLELDFGL